MREAKKGSGGPEPAARCAGRRQAERRESQGAPAGATMRVPRIDVPRQAGLGGSPTYCITEEEKTVSEQDAQHPAIETGSGGSVKL